MKIRQCIALAAASLISVHINAADLIAYDMLGSTSQNLLEHSNLYEGAFASAADGSQKYQRNVSSSIPFAVLDDSLSTFPADSLGIIDDNNLDVFFGITDTVNSSNSSGSTTATWSFAVAGQTNLAVSIDIGAMGDFESSDSFVWSASIDGATPQTLFTALVDESISQTYTLAGGSSFDLNDPLTINGSQLTNVLQTFVSSVTGAGSILEITFTATTDGGSEGLAFQNLQVLSNYEDTTTAPELSFIHDIQGNGFTSEMVGEITIIEGIVVGDFQQNAATDNGNLSGFYVQEEDTDADSDPQTSEGIFIYDADGEIDVAIGDKVKVTGEVKEYSGLTEISATEIEVLSSLQPLPQQTALYLPLSDEELESKEGMYVGFPQALVISEYYDYDRYGEIVLAKPLNGEERPMTPTAVELPGSPAYTLRAEQNRQSSITLDDGMTTGNPDFNRHPNGAEFSLMNRFRGGDMVSDTTGILEYRYGLYRIQPTEGANYSATNPRPVLPPYVGGEISVASFNVLNYFTTLDDGNDTCGPEFNMECRGADDADEFVRQSSKIITALAELNADIVGLIEIENSTTAVAELVASLNEYLGETVYAELETGIIGGDAIKVGYIYKPAKIGLVGDFALLDGSVDPDFMDDKNRPVLAQTFRSKNNHARFTVAINHLKSKGSDCDELDDPDLNDGQGNCNITRTLASQALVNWLESDPTNSQDDDFLILGDLNSYDKEEPISVLTNAGYTDLQNYFQGEFAYSYVFDGQFGYLDYALASTDLRNQITGTQSWHINADEPDILDYDTSYKSDSQISLFEANAFRSSDHDPVLVGLTLTPPSRCEYLDAHHKQRCEWRQYFQHWKKPKKSKHWWNRGFNHSHWNFWSK